MFVKWGSSVYTASAVIKSNLNNETSKQVCEKFCSAKFQ